MPAPIARSDSEISFGSDLSDISSATFVSNDSVATQAAPATIPVAYDDTAFWADVEVQIGPDALNRVLERKTSHSYTSLADMNLGHGFTRGSTPAFNGLLSGPHNFGTPPPDYPLTTPFQSNDVRDATPQPPTQPQQQTQPEAEFYHTPVYLNSPPAEVLPPPRGVHMNIYREDTLTAFGCSELLSAPHNFSSPSPPPSHFLSPQRSQHWRDTPEPPRLATPFGQEEEEDRKGKKREEAPRFISSLGAIHPQDEPVTPSQSEPVKRGRGRPRRNTVAAPAAPSTPTRAPASAPKTPTRRRQSSIAANPPAAPRTPSRAPAAAPRTPAKRRQSAAGIDPPALPARGRPRKSSIAQDVLPVAPVPAAASPRKRGPRKSAPSAPSREVKMESMDMDVDVPIPPTPLRRSPRKSGAGAVTREEKVEMMDVDLPALVTPSPRKRGPRQSGSGSSTPSAEGSSGSSTSASSSAGPSTPAEGEALTSYFGLDGQLITPRRSQRTRIPIRKYGGL
ncbi:hypothetical protein EIP86_003757 [Pleurotus ostreatoroseus]|nr:hypothetical protein EIP86_003757 [Pleurotus ostreatoroseus]